MSRLFVVFAFLLFLLGFVPLCLEACTGNGVCGLAPGCYGNYGGTGSYPYGTGYSAPSHTCGTCPPNCACGQYGCYRLRAASAHTFKPERARGRAMLHALEEAHRAAARGEEVEMPRVSELDNLAFISPTAAHVRRHPFGQISPNRAFMECCLDRQLPDACLRKCNYATYTKDALNRMYFKQDECPLEAMREIQFCAAQGGDHRECCARNGVTTTLAGQKCLSFCDQRPGRVTQLDVSYIPCFDRFESMKSCFWHDLTRFRFAKA